MERRRRRSSEDEPAHVSSDPFRLESDSDIDSGDNPLQLDAPDKSAPVTYFTHELSLRGRLRRCFIRNSTTRLAYTFFDLFLKSFICAIYVLRVTLDDLQSYECGGSQCYSVKTENGTKTNRPDGINWYVLLWVQRSLTLWLLEVILAAISLAKALLMIYISTKGHRMQQMMSMNFLLEMVCALPVLATLAYPPLLKDMFVPVFLNCKLAQRSLRKIYNDLHLTRQKFQTISVTLLQQMIILMTNIICLAFVTICMIQHLQRASPDNKLNMFDSCYFVVVTFSTVGYGDISPDIWLSRLYMVLMICIAFASVPRQIEGLISTYMERKKAGGEYSRRAAQRYRHVIVCTSSLTQDTVMDFLNEFYAHPKLEDHSVILLCPQELDSSMQVILKDPKWTHRVIYMKGSSLKDIDLTRCRVLQADACFFLAPRPAHDKVKADRHTILRSWAVKDFAPGCKQYIQLFSAANKIHVKFAEHVVCEDEFKYALLANNCLYPGLSTLVSLLVHTSSGHEGILASEPWQQVYGRHSGNEIYHIQLQKSVFFSQYDGETFPRASADAHHRFGVALLAVLDPDQPSPHLQLNPGPLYKLKGTDFCFYMSVTREEYSEVSPEALQSNPRRQSESIAQIALALQKYHLVPDNSPGQEDPDESVFNTITSLMGGNITRMVHTNNNQLQDEADTRTASAATTPSLTPDGGVAAVTTPDTGKNGSDNNATCTASAGGNSAPAAMGSKKRFTVTPATPATSSAGRGRHYNSSNNNTEDGCPSSQPLLQGHTEDTSSAQISLLNVTDSTTQPSEEDFRILRDAHSISLDSLDNVDHRHRAGRVLQYCTDMEQDKLTTGPPPVTMYSGSRRTTCHIMSEPRNLCCLEWGQDCRHCHYKNARDERWGHQLIILAAEHASTGIFNFIVPLRSSFIGVHGLSPIVLLLEEEPDNLFLDTIAQFPLVYYMMGSVKRVDDLLLAGINKASHLVVVNRDSDNNHGGEEILADSETIVAVQTIFRLFPNTYVVTELSQASNMRFMQFTAQEASAQKTSKLEQKLKESMVTNLNHIFRLPFAGGQVFSASMLDTLLYQTFVKGYLISFVRLLLGIDAEEGSGHLSSIRIKRATLQKFPEYGELYEGLCTATGEIPFAIYRTERVGKTRCGRSTDNFSEAADGETYPTNNKTTLKKSHSSVSKVGFSNLSRRDHGDLGGLIRNRLRSLDLNQADYSEARRAPDTLSYIITNPSPKLKLRIGDIVYVIQPSSMYAKPSKHKFYLHRANSCSETKLSAPPPSYMQTSRRRAHTTVDIEGSSDNSYRPSVPSSCDMNTSAAVRKSDAPRKRHSVPSDPRANPKGVSFVTGPGSVIIHEVTGHPDGNGNPSNNNVVSPVKSPDSNSRPAHSPVSDNVKPLSTRGKESDEMANNFAGVEDTATIALRGDSMGENKDGKEEMIPMEHWPVHSEKGSPHTKSFLVRVDDEDMSAVGNNRL